MIIFKLISQLSSEKVPYHVPTWWTDAVAAAIAKVKSYHDAGGPGTISFIQASDLHVHTDSDANPYYGRNIGHLIAAIMDVAPISATIISGDINTNGSELLSYVRQSLTKGMEYLEPAFAVGLVLLIEGNHDRVGGLNLNYTQAISSVEAYQILHRRQAEDMRWHYGPGGTYFYIDHPGHGTRFICLNSHDWPLEPEADTTATWNGHKNGGYTQTQLDWFCEALRTPMGWRIVVASHAVPCTINGRDHSGQRGYDIIRGIATAYNNRTSYAGFRTYDSSKGEGSWANIAVDVDFHNAMGEIVLWVGGHDHQYFVADPDITGLPFNVATVTSAGNYCYNAESEVTREIDTDHETGFAIYTVSPTEGKIYRTNLGVGEDAVIQYVIPNNYAAISYVLKNITSDNTAESVKLGESFKATLTPAASCDITSVVVTMNGENVTANAYADGVVDIESVAGDIVITAVAESSDPFAFVESNWSVNGNNNGYMTINEDSIELVKAGSNERYITCNHVFTRKAGTYSFSAVANGVTTNNYVTVIVQIFDADGNEITDDAAYNPNHSKSYNATYNGFIMSTGYASFTFTLSEDVATFKMKFAPSSLIDVGNKMTLTDLVLIEP